MELFQEILVRVFEKGDIKLMFPALNVEKLVEMNCYNAIKNIKAVIENDNLDDENCFKRIEHIVEELEALGSDGGNRHDFG